ncbi:hypothetical protein [Sedimentimonas flavescens]|uniref:hypothetical protein n=1 Tax=Sedimentimonas flavescens TaxID=2851012 RepID=UPI001C4A71E6|nr:hypothetical protein [Sedimentimonas flavescens]MBW0159638.1 hypothetical protein [Sedimentimonas flavescens]
MYLNHRAEIVFRHLRDYVRSPSLRHMRDPHSLGKLSAEIVAELDNDSAVWRKWDGPRKDVIVEALDCWIPADDMLEFLNSLPGPKLTPTDLAQHMRHLIEVESIAQPEEALRDECRAIYEEEKTAGTELPAIIGRISEYVVSQFERLRLERRDAEIRRIEEERLKQEQKLLSHSDCPWTQIRGSKCVYMRKNGRLFRLSPNADKTFTMHRVEGVDDGEPGEPIGRYRTRGDASKIVAKVAFEPDRRW